jgi:2',3'-cyclic-nucleotide 2'-phosphodiesterase (5'-nucleotidase family)
VFQRVRAGTTPCVIVDGGDFVADSSQALQDELSELMVEAMEIMAYDAVGLGEEELARGPQFLAEAAARLPLVCGNLRLGPGREGLIPPVRFLERDGRTVAVTGYVDPLLYYEMPGALDLPPDSLLVLDPVATLTPVIKDLRRRADLVVVLAHGSLDQVREWVPRVPAVDIVVQGHEPGMSRGLSPVGDAYLILAGPRSRQIGELSLTFDAQGNRLHANYRLFDLKKARGFPDGRLEALVEEFETRYGIE